MPAPALEAGRAALAAGAWAEALAHFAEAERAGAGAEAVEGYGTASRWLQEADAALDAHERAYRAYRAAGDSAGAARCAMALAMERWVFRGEAAVAMGWMDRAGRLLDGAGASPEQAWLSVWSGHVALKGDDDPVRARGLAEQAGMLARKIGLVDVEVLALAQQGLCLVSEGEVREGMRLLDAATAAALAGDVVDLDAISTSCCYMIDACRRVRDWDRAGQWCDEVTRFCARWSDQVTLAACRSQYADVLIWRGDWDRAEREITANLEELGRLGTERTADALARLGELRRRQGRRAEADDLLARAGGHPVALLGRAEAALDRGDPAEAVELAERLLRRLSADCLTDRAAGLEVLVRARLAAGDHAGADAPLAELGAVAASSDSPALEAAHAHAAGLLARAGGDLAGACGHLERAAERYERAGGPFEAARARLALAETLRDFDRPRSAAEEAEAAHARLTELGADAEAGRAAALLRDLGRELPSPAAGSSLTRREAEVLRLIGRGRSNAGIADDLVLSVRTVERHVSNIYDKLGLAGTAARAAAVAEAVRLGLT